MFDWNDIRYFLALQRSGKLLAAARQLRTTHATVARHIEQLSGSWASRCSCSSRMAIN